ncbi:hypothetical protein [Mucilaginibacter lacusdianchii]|uniref:hypothetical protein n=1 Tax=Mucilaginibacter lacusdianchii TaxID=2684211 RepID=UPI00131E6D1D|nr:hypothetical protein [Mucilaginibacter sp. JXJ CY 39]
MKNFVHLIFTFFISTIAFWGALATRKDPWPCYAIAFGVWAIFLWRYQARSKRAAMKRQFEEYQFREYMRWRAYRERS